MTGQANDLFFYDGKNYCLSAIQRPQQFFDIEKIGLTPEAENTACWRGYIATFSIHNSRLCLKNLDTNNGNGRMASTVKIGDTVPQIEIPKRLAKGYENWQNWQYANIHLDIFYSGSLLITDDFIAERYIHMGFQSPLSYRNVIELTFANGQFVSATDLSENVEKLRQNCVVETRDEQIACLPLWINECFDLSYEMKWRDSSKK